jgi:hypothetical protein
MGAFSVIILVVLFILMIGASQAFYEKTGIRMPSTSAMRRRARKQGINEHVYMDQGIKRKQKKLTGLSVPRKPKR